LDFALPVLPGAKVMATFSSHMGFPMTGMRCAGAAGLAGQIPGGGVCRWAIVVFTLIEFVVQQSDDCSVN